MTQGISGDAHIPLKRTEHVNIPAGPHTGGAIKEVQYNRVVTLRTEIEFPENTINIDKFPKMFTGRTNEILHTELKVCRNILK